MSNNIYQSYLKKQSKIVRLINNVNNIPKPEKKDTNITRNVK